MTQAILFDFDYTLADSSRAIVECFNTALAGIGLAHADPDAIRRTIGLSIPESLARVAGPEQLPRVEEFRLHWRRRSDEIMVDWTHVFDWTGPATAELAEAGFRLGIVSTKYRGRIADTLERHGLRDRFEVIVGGEDVTQHKPHPEGLHRALAMLAIEPHESLYVGDALVDAEAARQAQVPFVGVLSGMTSALELEHHPRVGILPTIERLPELLRSRALDTIAS